jgi:hypothetical protein
MLENIYRKLKNIYYLVFILLAFIVLLFYFFGGSFFFISIVADRNLDIALQTLCILSVLICIPFGLWFYAVRVRKLSKLDDEPQKLAAYFPTAILRMGLVVLAFMLNMVLYLLTQNNSMLFCAGIAALALIFCKPYKWKIAEELELEEEE